MYAEECFYAITLGKKANLAGKLPTRIGEYWPFGWGWL
jgi:hypothetical protein